MAWELWLKGLIAAVVSAVAGGVVLIIGDPTKFNLFNGGAKSLGEVSLVLALASGLNYLKNHPTPDDVPPAPGPGPLKAAGIILMIGCAGMLSGCALLGKVGVKGSPKHIATVSVASSHAVLSALQDFERANVCGVQGALAAPACIGTVEHKAISNYFVKAFDLDGTLASTVRAVPDSGTAVNAGSTASLLAQISDLVNKILALLPSSVQTKALALVGVK